MDPSFQRLVMLLAWVPKIHPLRRVRALLDEALDPIRRDFELDPNAERPSSASLPPHHQLSMLRAEGSTAPPPIVKKPGAREPAQLPSASTDIRVVWAPRGH